MSNIKRFKVCLNCISCIPIIPESNFYEFERWFDKEHKNHLIVIMTTKEMFIYAEKQYILRKIQKIDIILKELESLIDIPTKAEREHLNRLKSESIKLKKRLKQLKNGINPFNDVLTHNLRHII